MWAKSFCLLLAALCLGCGLGVSAFAAQGAAEAGLRADTGESGQADAPQAAPTAWDKATAFWDEHFSLGGWVELMESLRTEEPYDAVTARARGRLELKGNFDKLYGFVSVDMEKNWVIPDADGISLREAWLEYTGDTWDIRMGRQLIIWGKADGVRITDNICPTDFTEYLNREIDEMRIPVGAARLRVMSDSLIGELIWIPEFRHAKLAEGNNPWAIDSTASIPVPVYRKDAREPAAFSLEDSELAARLSLYMAGFDVSVSAFYTWDDMPANYYALRGTPQGPQLLVDPEYYRLMIYGLDFAKPWGDFVFRGEAALYQGRYLAVAGGQPEKHNVVNALLGADWSPGGNWTVTAQVMDTWVTDYEDKLTCDEHSPQATLNISKTLFNEMLTISNMLYYSMNDGEFFNRLQASYELAEGLELTVGWDKFHGDDGPYGVYRHNSQVWGKIRYTF